MHWIAPSENNAHNAALEKRLGDAADQLRVVKIQNLRRTRDLLLPRLLSAQVELSQLVLLLMAVVAPAAMTIKSVDTAKGQHRPNTGATPEQREPMASVRFRW